MKKEISTDEELLNDLKRVAKWLNKDSLSQKEFKANSIKKGPFVYHKRFGSWNKAMEMAGLTPNRVIERMNDQMVFDEIKRVAKKLNKKSITIPEFKQHSKLISTTVIHKRFGTWKNALKHAGIRYSKPSKIKIENDQLLDDVRRIAIELKKIRISTYDYNHNSPKYTATILIKRFGNWKNVLITAGWKRKWSGKKIKLDTFGGNK